jgi:subtilisin family serine protease
MTIQKRRSIATGFVGLVLFSVASLASADSLSVTGVRLDGYDVAWGTGTSMSGLANIQAAGPGLRGAGQTIAIIDTGVDYTHPALAGRYLGGYDFVNNDADPMDDNGHGTHVTGIAVNNHVTYGGVAPEANYVALKVLSASGSGSWDAVESALRWVNTNRQAYNITAVNLSLGTSSVYQTDVSSYLSDEFAALKNAGIFTSVASGNGYYTNDDAGGGVNYPAADPSTVSVGSVWNGNWGQVSWSSGATDYTTATDRIVSHADRHATMLDLLAPGALITSCSSNWETGSDWVTYGGTSMATPMVAGASMVLREAMLQGWPEGDMPVGAEWQDKMLSLLQDTGVKIYDGDDENDNVINLTGVTFRRVDIEAAVDVVPEPTVLFTLGVGALVLLKRKRRGFARGYSQRR